MQFPSRPRLVAALDAAVRSQSEDAITAALRRALVDLFAGPGFALPPALLQPIADHYARRELYLSPELGYSVIAMSWGPGQGTPIHDHDGAWCVECVWHGRLAITRYQPRERDGERWRFDELGTSEVHPGATDSLIPPHEYHAVRNPSAADIAVSLHVYQRALRRSHVFVAEQAGTGAAGWLRREERVLVADPAP